MKTLPYTINARDVQVGDHVTYIATNHDTDYVEVLELTENGYMGLHHHSGETTGPTEWLTFDGEQATLLYRKPKATPEAPSDLLERLLEEARNEGWKQGYRDALSDTQDAVKHLRETFDQDATR